MIIQNVSSTPCLFGGTPQVEGAENIAGPWTTLVEFAPGPQIAIYPGERAEFVLRHSTDGVCATPVARSYPNVRIELGGTYALPGFALNWSCGDLSATAWALLTVPLDQVAPNVTQAPNPPGR